MEVLLIDKGRIVMLTRESKGLTNKELAKFTDRINALCDKYAKK